MSFLDADEDFFKLLFFSNFLFLFFSLSLLIWAGRVFSNPGGKRGPEQDEEPSVVVDVIKDLFGLKRGPNGLDNLIGDRWLFWVLGKGSGLLCGGVFGV